MAPDGAPLPSTTTPEHAPESPAAIDTWHAVSPLHVLLLGGAALGSGAAVTSAFAYKEAGRTLRAEGVDPRARRAVLPVALRAALGSLALTAGAAWGGFWLLRAYGAVRDAPASLPTPGEAWDALFKKGGGKRVEGQEEAAAAAAAAPAAGAGDGSTLRSLSAAWRRREGLGSVAGVAAAEEQQPAAVDTSKRRHQGRWFWPRA